MRYEIQNTSKRNGIDIKLDDRFGKLYYVNNGFTAISPNEQGRQNLATGKKFDKEISDIVMGARR